MGNGIYDLTLDIAVGCERVSAGCANCFAAERVGPSFFTERVRPDNEHVLREAIVAVNDRHQAGDVRLAVMASNTCDVFERHTVIDAARERLFQVIKRTPHVDWYLLTKRPENLQDMWPEDWMKTPPRNAWVGISAESQAMFMCRHGFLMRAGLGVKLWLCAQPLLGPIDPVYLCDFDALVVGGEGGPNARPCNPDWIDALTEEAARLGIRFSVDVGTYIRK